MENEQTVKIDLKVENENGNTNIETIEVSKQAVDILNECNISPEDLLNYFAIADNLDIVIKNECDAESFNAIETRLLKIAMANSLNKIGIHQFDVTCFIDAVNSCIGAYAVDLLDADYIVNYYNVNANRFS